MHLRSEAATSRKTEAPPTACKCLIVPRGQFPAFAPKHAESPAVLRISYGYDQLSIRPTVVTGNNAFSALKGLRNLKSHVGKPR
jgi:hypothetical protein